MEKSYTVYCHISPSNKRYIGITSLKVKERWANGKGYRTQQYFYRAINKYGWENFQHIIVAKGLSEEEAKWLEIELIKVWNSANKEYGYNISLGGESGNHSEETKKKLSEINKGKILSEEHKMKISEANKGRFCGENNPNYGKDWREGKSEEELKERSRKISEALKGKELSEETKKKLSEINKGKKLSEETKKKISENNSKYWKGKHLSEEIKKKISENKKGKESWMKGKHHTEESKKKISESCKGKLCGKNHPQAKMVICITTRRIFDTAKEGAEYYNCTHSHIITCCKGKRNYCGKLSDDTPLVWMYLEDYEKATEEEINKKIEDAKNSLSAKSVICLTTGRIFNTAKEGAEYYNCNHNNIFLCCKGKRKSCGKLPDGTPLVWRYIKIIEL